MTPRNIREQQVEFSFLRLQYNFHIQFAFEFPSDTTRFSVFTGLLRFSHLYAKCLSEAEHITNFIPGDGLGSVSRAFRDEVKLTVYKHTQAD